MRGTETRPSLDDCPQNDDERCIQKLEMKDMSLRWGKMDRSGRKPNECNLTELKMQQSKVLGSHNNSHQFERKGK